MDNHYQEKYDEFIRNIHKLMFIFEVTKCSGYSTFATIYTPFYISNAQKTRPARQGFAKRLALRDRALRFLYSS